MILEPAETPRGTAVNSDTTPRLIDDMRGVRYGEVLAAYLRDFAREEVAEVAAAVGLAARPLHDWRPLPCALWELAGVANSQKASTSPTLANVPAGLK